MEFEKEEDHNTFVNAMKELCKEYDLISDSRLQANEIIKEVSDSLDIPKPIIRKVAKIYHKKNAAEIKSENEFIEELYSSISVK
jgi:hypothetical protein